MEWPDLLSADDGKFVMDTAAEVGLADNAAAKVLARMAMAEGKSRVANASLGVIQKVVSKQAKVVDMAYALDEARLRDLEAQVRLTALSQEMVTVMKEIEDEMLTGGHPELLVRMQELGYYLETKSWD